ncbi:enolase-phosphatase E1 [Blastocladiella emersonii ATCC 22665]|nr:enolase-phosphatase E1 [Blastocladiella emersonii ATCC 22665]
MKTESAIATAGNKPVAATPAVSQPAATPAAPKPAAPMPAAAAAPKQATPTPAAPKRPVLQKPADRKPVAQKPSAQRPAARPVKPANGSTAPAAATAASGFNGQAAAATDASTVDIGRPVARIHPYRVVLADIEGTTTDIAFVHDVLFPYARTHVEPFLRAHASDPAVAAVIRDLHAQSVDDVAALAAGGPKAAAIPGAADFVGIDDPANLDQVIANVKWQMAHDRKSTPLKALQGHIWRSAYESGKVKGHLYTDVLPALYHYQAVGVPVFIYSSGSIAAQKLLFGHSDFGDLQPMLAGYFDTTIGNKLAPKSYGDILQQIRVALNDPKLQRQDILFLSDNSVEVSAARTARLQVALALRPGNPPIGASIMAKYPCFHSFSQLISPELHAFWTNNKALKRKREATLAPVATAPAAPASAPDVAAPPAKKQKKPSKLDDPVVRAAIARKAVLDTVAKQLAAKDSSAAPAASTE